VAVPTPLRRGLLALAILSACASPAAARVRFAPTTLIVEGRSIAGVHVGDTRAQVTRAWGPPDKRCDGTTTYLGVICHYLEHLEVTYDGTAHVVAISADYRVNVTQARIVGNARRRIYATRSGIGPIVAQNTLLRHYGARLTLLPKRTDPGFGGVDRTWILHGPAGRVTLFGVVGASGGRNGGQTIHMTVARALTPSVAGPARLDIGGSAPVSADGLVPGTPYRFEVSFPGAEPVPLASVTADAAGHAQATIAYDGALAAALAVGSTAVSGDVAGALRLQALDGTERPFSARGGATAGGGRPLWLGPLLVSEPLAVAAPATTMTVEPTGPVSFDTPLTVRFGGVPPITLQGDQAPGLSYSLVFQAPCGADDQSVFQDPVAGVLALPGAADQRSPQRAVRSACSGLPAGQAVTVPLVLTRNVDLPSGAVKSLVAAVAPVTFLRP
jgi:hypothetical protein